ncbi:hypothetical protein [Parvularcula marina]|nr:hypothetical protein [Parvularcula marina]
MRLRGITLSMMAAIAALPAMGAVSSAAAQNPPPFVECRNELDTFQNGRDTALSGVPWAQAQNMGTPLRRKCSLLGWYEGMNDFCSERLQLVAGRNRQHGLELCLYKNTRAAMKGRAVGMDALIEMMGAVDMASPAAPLGLAAAKKKYSAKTEDSGSLAYKIDQEIKALGMDPACPATEDDANFPPLIGSSDERRYGVLCHMKDIRAAAEASLGQMPYAKLHATHKIGFNYSEAENNLQIEKANVASIRDLINRNEAQTSALYRQRNDTTNARRYQELTRQIEELESRVGGLRLSLENAVDRENEANRRYKAAQQAYEQKRVALERS